MESWTLPFSFLEGFWNSYTVGSRLVETSSFHSFQHFYQRHLDAFDEVWNDAKLVQYSSLVLQEEPIDVKCYPCFLRFWYNSLTLFLYLLNSSSANCCFSKVLFSTLPAFKSACFLHFSTLVDRYSDAPALSRVLTFNIDILILLSMVDICIFLFILYP